LDPTRLPDSYGPMHPLDDIARQNAKKGLTPELTQQLAAGEADTLARMRATVEQRMKTLETTIGQRTSFGPDHLDAEYADLARQADTLRRDETILRALAEPTNPQLRADALAELAQVKSVVDKEGKLVATATDQAAKGSQSIQGWTAARGRSDNLAL